MLQTEWVPRYQPKIWQRILNKLAKLGDAIAISKSETISHSLTHSLAH